MQGQHLLLTLLCFGVLSTVTGCYYDPSPYQSRPRPHEHRQYYEGERRQDYDGERDYRQRERDRYERRRYEYDDSH